jgi:predicted DNA-binding transcriptional regulator AlpA
MRIFPKPTTGSASQQNEKYGGAGFGLSFSAVTFSSGLMMSQIYLSRRQAAKRAGVAANTLGNYEKSGRGPSFIKLHGKHLYRADDIDAWLTQHKVGGAV